ncbi:MAG: YIP1 family protein [bacterium]|nr:YIP1 family protein [bacterium]
MKALDLVSGILFDPVTTLRRAAAGHLALPLTLGLAAMAVAGASSLAGFPGHRLGLTLVGLLASLLVLFGQAAVLNLVAELLGGGGNGRGLLAALALAQVPSALLAPAGLLAQVAGWLGTLTRLALFAWVFVLQLLAVREAHRLTTGRALAVVLIPLGAFFVFLVVLIAAVVRIGVQGVPIPDIF